MEQALLITQMTAETLSKHIRVIVQEELKKLQGNEPPEERLLSPRQVCKLFEPNLSRTTLYNLDKIGVLVPGRLGRRVFYKYSEVLESIKKYKKYERRNW